MEFDRSAVAKLGYKDPVFFCRFFLAEWFQGPMPWFHRGMLALLTKKTDFLLDFKDEVWPDGTRFSWTPAHLDKILRHFVWRENPEDPLSPEHSVFVVADGKIDMLWSPQILLLLPRGFGKTTIVNAADLYLTVYNEIKFPIYVSETKPAAEMQLQNVKNQLSENERIIEVFGKLAPERNDTLKWRDDYIETRSGVTMAARGRGSQIRGLMRDGKRPDLIVADDIEDEDSVKTPEQRKKAMKWFMGTLLPARKRIGGEGRVIVIGTALHIDAMLMNLMRDPSFICINLEAIDKDGDALWEANMSLGDLEKAKRRFQLQHELSTYYLEYHNQIRNDETAMFTSEMFRYQFIPRTDFVAVALALDPAIGDKVDSDYAAFGVVGITEKGLLSVIDCRGAKNMTPDAQVELFFELNNTWKPTVRGVETVAFQKALMFSLRSSMPKMASKYGSSAYFDIQPIASHTAKAERIKGILAPRYRAGYIVHQRRFSELEQQLIDYPGRHDDFPDVIAMCIMLLDPQALLGIDPALLEDKTMPDLELEIGEWRSAP